MSHYKKTLSYGKHQLTLETGEIARQASGAVMVSLDDTVVLVTVVADVVRAYLDMRGLQTQYAVLGQNIRSARKSLDRDGWWWWMRIIWQWPGFPILILRIQSMSLKAPIAGLIGRMTKRFQRG